MRATRKQRPTAFASLLESFASAPSVDKDALGAWCHLALKVATQNPEAGGDLILNASERAAYESVCRSGLFLEQERLGVGSVSRPQNKCEAF